MLTLRLKSTASILAVTLLLSSGCATIVGGSQYNAYISILDKPAASIYYKGSLVGTGSGTLKIPRKDANKLSFKVTQEGCPEQQFNYTNRGFRGWALVGSFFTFTIPTPTGIPFPIGNIVDFATGAYFKPEKSDPSIRKIDYNNYQYNLNYTLCNTEQQRFVPSPINSNPAVVQTKEDKLIELKELFDSGMITEEEYESSRKVILVQ